MRILHFTNIPFNIDQIRSNGQNLTTSGGWMAMLLGRLLHTTDFQLANVAFGNTKNTQISKNKRIVCYTLPPQRNEKHNLLLCRKIVNDWNPDLLHIHGTENIFGLLTARKMVNCPAVISLQGLLGPCSEWYHYFGNRNLGTIAQMHRALEVLAFRGQWRGFLKIRAAARREQEILTGNLSFMGRTEWDRAYLAAVNPTAQYFHENRLLREDFWGSQWKLQDAQPHRIIFTNAGHPRKGAEVLLKAGILLKKEFPDIQICIAGGLSYRSGYGRYLRKKIKSLPEIAIELGQLNAQEMKLEMLKSHVFVSPSFIDNSPNAISEAQLLGMPIISTYTGGVPSLIKDGETGLFFQTGDSPMLAARLREVFTNDTLATQIGTKSNNVASARHNPDIIIKKIIHIYEHLVSGLHT